MQRIFLLLFIGFTSFLYSQNVGIGTAIPASKLEVRGDFRLSGSPSNYVNFTLPASSQTTNYILPSSTGTNGQFLKTDGTGSLSWSSMQPNSWDNYLLVEEQRANGVAQGNATAGIFNVRELNRTQKLVGNAILFDSIANTITLSQVGTYFIRAGGVTYRADRNQLAIRDLSNNTLLTGMSSYTGAPSASTPEATLEGFITVTSSPITFKLTHFITITPNNPNTLGIEPTTSGLNGVFSRCFVQKIETTPTPSPSPPISSSWSDYLVVEEQNAPLGTVASVAGYQIRGLNTITASNGSSITCNLIAHTITLLPGTYHIVASAPASQIANHQMLLRNTGTLLPIALGQSSHSNDEQTFSSVDCIITVGINTTFKMDHYTSQAHPDGLGISGGATGVNNVYARCLVHRIQ